MPESDFTDYRLFEFIAFLKKSKQLTPLQREDLFGFYLGCLEKTQWRHGIYLELENGYEGVLHSLSSRKRVTNRAMTEYLFFTEH